ncbi:MAG: hypothetical protein QM831_11765 [Kofleriaceae bacterium]
MHKPTWWNDQHEGTWDRVKDALKRDWEQTKNDLSSKKGADLDQNVGDTVKQAAGKEPIPPGTTPNAKWDDDVESSYRLGVGAHERYGKEFPTWSDKLETKLSGDWNDLKTGKDWDSVKAHIKRAWHSVKN